MRVSICGIQNESDLQKVVQSDADAAGFLVGQIHQSARFILPSTAGRLAAQLPPFISPAKKVDSVFVVSFAALPLAV